MVKELKEILRKEALITSVYIILMIIVVNAVLSFYFRNVIIENSLMRERILQANHGIEFMNKFVNLADLGLRGFMIDQDEKFLFPYNEAIDSYKDNFDQLRVVLAEQGFSIEKMEPAEKAVDDYMKLVQEMVQMCMDGNVAEAVEILKADPGYDAWKIYSVFEGEALEFEQSLAVAANDSYSTMIRQMIFSQVLLLIIGVPILVAAVVVIKKNRKTRNSLFKRLQVSNKKYVFNSGEDYDVGEEELVISRLISNLHRTADFVKSIAAGNFDISWEGMNKDNAELNKDNIAGELTEMRDQMKKVKAEDDIRLWTASGLSEFAEIVRENQSNFKVLAEKLISKLVNYLNTQQGGLFIVNTADSEDPHLELMGCYAYNRTKTIEKKIAFGQGLVGQCYLEKESIYLTKVPQDYVHITSGLGDTRPNCVLIVPMRLNETIEGVIELASLKPFEKHEIEFVEKLGEVIASATINVRTAENTKVLLEQSQQQTEEMRAQEEEMRQNMEELQATQEQMHRKNQEIEQLLEKADKNESSIKQQNMIINDEKKTLETEKAILATLMEVLPDRVTIKDKNGTYLKVSQSKYKSLREKGFSKVIGRSDREMFGQDHFEKSIQAEKEIMKNDAGVFGIVERIEISDGVFIWGSTTRVPLKDKSGEMLGTVVVTRDITKEKEYGEELESLKSKG